MRLFCVCEILVDVVEFFFSSRRRHTRYWRDWSSDVCSSDLDLISGLFSWDFSHILFCWKAEEPHNCFGGVVSRYVYCKEEFGFGS